MENFTSGFSLGGVTTRVNQLHHVSLADGRDNTAVGLSTESARGSNNTAVGAYAGAPDAQTDGMVMVGARSGQGLRACQLSVLLGAGAARRAQLVQRCVLVGADAGLAARSALLCTALGHGAGSHMTGGLRNTAVGAHSGMFNVDTADNTFVGESSGVGCRGGSRNVCVGAASGQSGLGSDNVLLGYNAQAGGSRNICIGSGVGGANLGSDNLVVGFQSGSLAGSNNVSLGGLAGNADGLYNVFVGSPAVAFQGSRNVSVGTALPGARGEGDDNVLLGFAGAASFVGSRNLTVGAPGVEGNDNVLMSRAGTVAGSNNVTLGGGAVTGDQNVLLGLGGPWTGDRNVRVGGAPASASAGSDNVHVGHSTGALTGQRNTRVGAGTAAFQGVDCVHLGFATAPIAGNSTVSVGCATAAMSGLRAVCVGARDGPVSGDHSVYVGSVSGALAGDRNTCVGARDGGTLGGTENAVLGFWHQGSVLGDRNVLAGAMRGGLLGSNNAVLGHSSAATPISGTDNVLVGSQTGNLRGDKNVVLGDRGLGAGRRGDKNVLVGTDILTAPHLANVDGCVLVGSDITHDGSVQALANSVVIGRGASVSAADGACLVMHAPGLGNVVKATIEQVVYGGGLTEGFASASVPMLGGSAGSYVPGAAWPASGPPPPDAGFDRASFDLDGSPEGLDGSTGFYGPAASPVENPQHPSASGTYACSQPVRAASRTPRQVLFYNLNPDGSGNIWKRYDYDALLARYPVGTFWYFQISTSPVLFRARFNAAENSVIRNTDVWTSIDGATWTPGPGTLTASAVDTGPTTVRELSPQLVVGYTRWGTRWLEFDLAALDLSATVQGTRYGRVQVHSSGMFVFATENLTGRTRASWEGPCVLAPFADFKTRDAYLVDRVSDVDHRATTGLDALESGFVVRWEGYRGGPAPAPGDQFAVVELTCWDVPGGDSAFRVAWSAGAYPASLAAPSTAISSSAWPAASQWFASAGAWFQVLGADGASLCAWPAAGSTLAYLSPKASTRSAWTALGSPLVAGDARPSSAADGTAVPVRLDQNLRLFGGVSSDTVFVLPDATILLGSVDRVLSLGSGAYARSNRNWVSVQVVDGTTVVRLELASAAGLFAAEAHFTPVGISVVYGATAANAASGVSRLAVPGKTYPIGAQGLPAPVPDSSFTSQYSNNPTQIFYGNLDAQGETTRVKALSATNTVVAGNLKLTTLALANNLVQLTGFGGAAGRDATDVYGWGVGSSQLQHRSRGGHGFYQYASQIAYWDTNYARVYSNELVTYGAKATFNGNVLVSSRVLAFNTFAANTKLALTGSVTDPHAVNAYSLGMGPGTRLRYNVPAAASHAWYANNVDLFLLNAANATLYSSSTVVAGNLSALANVTVSGQMRFGSTARNNILQLWGNSLDPDATTGYGFGVNSNKLRYNSQGTHGFFVGGAEAVTLGTASAFQGVGVSGEATFDGNVRVSRTVTFDGALANTKICLSGPVTDPDAFNVFSLGRTSGEFVYNAPAAASHAWYVNGTQVLKVNVSSVVTDRRIEVTDSTTAGGRGVQFSNSAYFGPLVEKRQSAVSRFGVAINDAGTTRVYTSGSFGAAKVALGFAVNDTSFTDALVVARAGGNIAATSFVGINAPSPLAELHVGGNVRATGRLALTAPTTGNNKLCVAGFGGWSDPDSADVYGWGVGPAELQHRSRGAHAFYKAGAPVAYLDTSVSALYGGSTQVNALSVGGDATLAGNVSMSGSSVMRFGNAFANNIVCLHGNNLDPAAVNVYGLGVTSATMRYNAPAGATHNWYANDVQQMSVGGGIRLHVLDPRAPSTSFNILVLKAGGVNQFRVRGDGATLSNGAYSSSGADYAEFFEWADGNPRAEDRVGLAVALDADAGGKVREARPGDDPIGVVSARPSVVGDAAWSHWHGKYRRDDYGRALVEPAEVLAWGDGDDQWCLAAHAHLAPEGARRETRPVPVLDPAFDPTEEYVPRDQRREWACVGLVGKLRVRAGQVVGARWLRLRGFGAVTEYLVR